MKRGMILLSFILVVIGSAGYLGAHSVRDTGPPTTASPTTVEVTRGAVRQTMTAPGQLVATHQVALAAGVGGQVAQILVRAGDPVQSGDVLVQIDPAPFEETVAVAQASADAAHVHSADAAHVQQAQLQAEPTAAKLAAAELALARAKASLDSLLAGPSAAAVASAGADVAAAEQNLAHLESLPDPSSVAQAQAELERRRDRSRVGEGRRIS